MIERCGMRLVIIGRFNFPIERRDRLIRASIKRTDQTLADKGPAGVLDWIRILKAISDEEMKQICGTDAALYIIFVRYAAYFFGIAAIFGFAVLVPIYATGDPEKPSLVYDETARMKIALLLISIVNCTKIQAKVATSFGIILIFYTSAIFFFLFLFWKRSLRWRFREIKQGHSYSDAEIAQQSIFISHLQQTVSMQMMKTRI